MSEELPVAYFDKTTLLKKLKPERKTSNIWGEIHPPGISQVIFPPKVLKSLEAILPNRHPRPVETLLLKFNCLLGKNKEG